MIAFGDDIANQEIFASLTYSISNYGCIKRGERYLQRLSTYCLAAHSEDQAR